MLINLIYNSRNVENKKIVPTISLSLKKLENELDCQMNFHLKRRCQVIINPDVAGAILLMTQLHLLQYTGKNF
jgi:hypothetical protein